MLLRLLVAAILCCSSFVLGQESDLDELPRSEFQGLTQKQITRRIFSKEQEMVGKLAKSHFVTEAYMQSLGHRQAKGIDLRLGEASDSVIDDLYVLARVDFGNGYGASPVERILIGERPWRHHYILKNTGALEHIFPAGFLSMLFVDLYGFDADKYSLTYKGRESLFNTECLVFSVAPRSERDSGRFRGDVWIDSSSLGIVRAKGVFTGPFGRWYRGSGKYFHFDTWRERIASGLWVPSVAYFNERRAFHSDGNLEFHYRGYAVLWQQGDEKVDAPSSGAGSDAEDSSVAENSVTRPSQNSLVARLEADGLLAAQAYETQNLDRIVEAIAPISDKSHKIECRVLLTTPLEMFAVGDVIIVSRGLLNVVPDDSVLAVMLARQVAHIVLGHTSDVERSLPKSLFERVGKGDLEDLGIHWRPDQEVAANSRALVLLKSSRYERGVASASTFLSELESESHRFPNLARPRFGAGVFGEAGVLASKQQTGPAALRFENRFRVSLNRVLIDSDRQSEQAQGRTAEKPVVVKSLER